MNLLHLTRIGLLSAAGLASTIGGAAQASADELHLGLSFGGHHGTRGFVGVSLGSPSRGWYGTSRGPVVHAAGYGYYGFGGPTHTFTRVGYPTPAYEPAVYEPSAYAPPTLPTPYASDPMPVADPCCRQVFLPPTTTFREQVVCEAPVFETRCVPVFQDVCVPVFAERFDARTRRLVRVKVGDRMQHVQVGTRDERVLVRPESKHVVRVPETVPGRMVWICDDRAHRHEGEVMTEAEYRALLQQAQAFSVTR